MKDKRLADTVDLKRLGFECKLLRESLEIPLREVADELGCTVQNVSAFEHGKVNSFAIFYWYLKRGFEIDKWRGEVHG